MTTRLSMNAALTLGALGLVACGGGEGGERPQDMTTTPVTTGTTGAIPVSTTTGTGTTDTTTTTTPTGSTSTAAAGSGEALVPDATGWVDGAGNGVGIQGPWYGYDDCMDSPGDCTNVITPPLGDFPNTGGSMCASGSTAIVNSEAEFTTKWGVGIALDLNNAGGDAEKAPYNATANGVTGFSFSITAVPAGGIRVNFPTPTTVDTSHFKTITTSGPQTVLFSEAMQGSWVTTPTALDTTQITAIQFQVPSQMGTAVTYDFCVEGLTALK